MNTDCKTEWDRLHENRLDWEAEKQRLQHYLPMTPTLPHVL